ncbi:hypothetical protein ACWEQ8_31980 [Streptomyces noursei]
MNSAWPGPYKKLPTIPWETSAPCSSTSRWKIRVMVCQRCGTVVVDDLNDVAAEVVGIALAGVELLTH